MTPLSFQEFSSGVAEAENFWSVGDWQRARDTYSELLYRRLSDGAPLSANELLVAERLADLAAPFGDFADADTLYAAVAAAYENQGASERSDAAILKRAHLALASDRLDDAASLLRSLEPRIGTLEAIEFTPDGMRAFELRVRWRGSYRPLALVQFYLQGGRTLAGFGQFTAAVAAFRRALSHCVTDAELARLAETPVRLALAGALVEAGDFDQAQNEIAALELRVDPAREPGYAASLWEASAKVQLLKGEFAAAEAHLRRVVDLCRSFGFAAPTATAATNLAELLVVLNRVHEAAELLDQASAIAHSLTNPAVGQRVERVRFIARCREGSVFGDETLALPVLAMQAGFNSELAPASPQLEPARVYARPTSYLAFYESRELDFLADVHHRDLDRAASRLRSMRADFAGTTSRLIAVRLRVLTAVLACERARHADAEILLAQAAGEFRALGALPELYQCRRIQALCWDKLRYPAARRAALREENDALLEQLAAALGSEAREAYLLNKWRQRELVLGQAVDQLARLRDERAAASGWRSLVSGWKAFRQAGALICRIDKTGARNGWSLWSRLAWHSWRRRTIGFLVLPNSTFTYSMGWLSLHYRIGTATRVGVRSLVKTYQGKITSLDARSQSAASQAAAKIAEVLGLPELLRKTSARVRHLTFVPDDQLHGFPFAAIPLESPNHSAALPGITLDHIDRSRRLSCERRPLKGAHRRHRRGWTGSRVRAASGSRRPVSGPLALARPPRCCLQGFDGR